MFRPERMSLVAVMALEPQVELVTAAIARAGILHLVEAPGIPDFSAARPRERGRALLERAEALEARAEELARRLLVPGAKRPKVSLSLGAEGYLNHVEQQLSGLERAVESAETRVARAREDETAYQEISALLELVESDSTTIADLRGGEFSQIFLGFVSVEELPALRANLDRTPCAHASGWAGKIRRAVCVATSVAHAEEVRRMLSSAGFVAASIPEDLSGSVVEAHEEIEERVWAAREDEAEARAELAELSRRRGSEVAQWIVELKALRKIEQASLHFGTTGTVEVIAGWVPSARLSILQRLVENVGGSKVVFVEIQQAEVRDSASAPTSLRNPPMIRAFESLVNLYGTPPYDGIDPTPFVALSFTLMFGVMFGDLGHGLVLAAVGLGLWLFFRPFSGAGRDLGEIILFCGLSATLFGFLCGSVFGDESLLRPVLFHVGEREHINDILQLGIGLGVLMLSMGMLLNVAQQLMRRRWKEALVGEWGVASLVFYWGLIAVLIYSVSAPGAPRSRIILLLCVMLGPPLLLTAFRGPLGYLVELLRTRTARRTGAAHGEEEDTMTAVMGTAVAVLEMVTNTFSHIRVAAFALNHAALCTAVRLIAEVLREAHTGEAVTWTAIVLGNVVIISLEGLIVFIQSMRLHFYEFFSKFFMHMGVPYAPLRID